MKDVINYLARYTGKNYAQVYKEFTDDLKNELYEIMDGALELDVEDGNWFISQDSIDTAAERIIEAYDLYSKE